MIVICQTSTTPQKFLIIPQKGAIIMCQTFIREKIPAHMIIPRKLPIISALIVKLLSFEIQNIVTLVFHPQISETTLFPNSH